MTGRSTSTTPLAIASDFVKAGMERAGVALTDSLAAYLSITFVRFFNSEIRVDLLDGAGHPGDGRQRAAGRDPLPR